MDEIVESGTFTVENAGINHIDSSQSGRGCTYFDIPKGKNEENSVAIELKWRLGRAMSLGQLYRVAAEHDRVALAGAREFYKQHEGDLSSGNLRIDPIEVTPYSGS